MFVQGAWLEGSPIARTLEWIRIAGALALAAGAYFIWPDALHGAALLIAAYAAASAAAVSLERVLPARVAPATSPG
jgi:hypothetical protein